MEYQQLNLVNHTVYFILGHNSDEKFEKRKVILNISIRFQIPNISSKTDSLSDTICYADFLKFLDSNLENKEFNLIERAAQFVYEMTEKYISEKCLIEPTAVLKKIEVIKPYPFHQSPDLQISSPILAEASYVISDW